MKQHPVDDVFARKLTEHSIKPQRATWEEMQKRMNPQPQRRIGARLWYAAAASVLLLMLAGWWSWKSGNLTEAPTGQLVARVPGKPQPHPRINPPAGETQQQEKQLAAASNEEQEEKKRRVKGGVQPQTENLAGEGKEPVTFLADEPVRLTQNTLPAPTSQQTSVDKPAEEMPSVKTAPVIRERTLVVKIDEPALVAGTSEPAAEPEEAMPRKKRVRIGRLLRQLNNLREGEPVDWQDAGVDPNTIMAKATETVETGKERITESYENIRSRAFNKQENNK